MSKYVIGIFNHYMGFSFLWARFIFLIKGEYKENLEETKVGPLEVE